MAHEEADAVACAAQASSQTLIFTVAIAMGSGCHEVPTSIGACPITAMIIYIFERVLMEVDT